MRLLDEQYTRTPFVGVRKMTDALRKQGYIVNPKRVRRLLRQMGLEAIYPKPRLSEPAPGHRIYPYRLRQVVITTGCSPALPASASPAGVEYASGLAQLRGIFNNERS